MRESSNGDVPAQRALVLNAALLADMSTPVQTTFFGRPELYAHLVGAGLRQKHEFEPVEDQFDVPGFVKEQGPDVIALSHADYSKLLAQGEASRILLGYVARHLEHGVLLRKDLSGSLGDDRNGQKDTSDQPGSMVNRDRDSEASRTAQKSSEQNRLGESRSAQRSLDQDRGKGLISVVVPVYNEEELASELFRRMESALGKLPEGLDYEVIFVNDGSRDRTLAILGDLCAKKPKFKLVDLSRNFGHQIALTAGIDCASGDAVVAIDGDLQDPPEVILEMVAAWQRGVDIAYGLREKRLGETFFKKATAGVFYRMINAISEVPLPRDAGDFRLMDRKVVESFAEMREQSRYIRGMVSWLGFRSEPVLFTRDSRYAGETKYSLVKMLKLATDAVTSFSTKPLYLSGYFGVAMCVLGLAGVLYLIAAKVLNFSGLVPGWTSLMVVMLVTSGAQLICLTIVGQYIARIYQESKKRPLYVISEKFNFDN